MGAFEHCPRAEATPTAWRETSEGQARKAGAALEQRSRMDIGALHGRQELDARE